MNVYVREVARHLGRLGLAVDVFTRSQTPGVPEVVPLGPGARVIHVAAGPEKPVPPHLLLPYLDTFAAGVAAFRQRAGLDYTLIHGHYWLSGIVALPLAEAWGGRPVVQMFHTLGAVTNAVVEAGPDRVPRERVEAESRLIAAVDRVVAATPLERADLAWHYGADVGRIRVIPCGVDVERFRPGPQAEARARLGLEAERVLLFVGRLAPIKGLEILLGALGRLRAEPKAPARLRLLIVGGDRLERWSDDGDRLRRLAAQLGVADWVQFRGPQPQDTLLDYYRAADLCLMPSRHESFGMVALEAMACGVPVIASRVGGLATTVQDGLTGLLVPGGDETALAAAIGALLADGPRRRVLGRQAVAWVQAFAWPRVARAVADLYGELVPDLRLDGWTQPAVDNCGAAR
jgi:D-inositol-3-phosphate glycosyltransferase